MSPTKLVLRRSTSAFSRRSRTSTVCILGFIAAMVAGCASDGGSSNSGSSGAGSSGGGSSGGGAGAIERSPETAAALAADPDGVVFVAVTHARLDPAKRAPFDEHVKRVVAALPATPGYVPGTGKLRNRGAEVWTLSVWHDEPTLDDFLEASTHRTAVTAGRPAMTSMRHHRFAVPIAEAPVTFERAIAALDAATAAGR